MCSAGRLDIPCYVDQSGVTSQLTPIPWPTVAQGRFPLRRILVVQSQRLGDVVVLTPMLTAIRHQFPAAHLAVLVHRPHDVFLQGNPDVDQILTYDRQTTHRSLAARGRLIGELRAGRYDWALSIHAASSLAFAVCSAGIPWRTCVWRYGPGQPPHWARWFHQRIVQDRADGRQHEAEYNLDVLRELGIEPRHTGYRVSLTEEERETASRWLENEGRVPEQPLAVLHPGHGGGRQAWAPGRYAAVADGLVRLGLQVAITGGPGEEAEAAQVVTAMAGTALNLAGRMSLRRLIAVLAEAHLYISVPTGPMHLASAVKVPIVPLYGPTDLDVDRIRFCPFRSPYEEVVSPVPCTCPASKVCTNAVCMEGITPDAVLAAARGLLSRTLPDPGPERTAP
ncbi:MAG: glycosyltransferase family 9 protein [Armatimonadetes bacterium]|nr:glycosyltransferase family 9 protein [Armatimonadota bacterium]